MTGGTLPARDDIGQIAEAVCTPIQLRVFQLRERHGFSWHQIAAATGKDQSTVRGHYHRAVRRIVIYVEKAS